MKIAVLAVTRKTPAIYPGLPKQAGNVSWMFERKPENIS